MSHHGPFSASSFGAGCWQRGSSCTAKRASTPSQGRRWGGKWLSPFLWGTITCPRGPTTGQALGSFPDGAVGGLVWPKAA